MPATRHKSRGYGCEIEKFFITPEQMVMLKDKNIDGDSGDEAFHVLFSDFSCLTALALTNNLPSGSRKAMLL